MSVNSKISRHEFLLFQKFILEQCGIFFSEDKAFLLESRLAKLMEENNIKSYINLYNLICNNKSVLLVQKVIDAITTKETFWFREKTPWAVLEEKLLPGYVNMLSACKHRKIKIWSAACATGQEPYSIAMCIDRYLKSQQIKDVTLKNFEILATDISVEAITAAQKGQYDNVTMTRGLDDYYRSNYFSKTGRYWTLDGGIRSAVQFEKFNLLESFFMMKEFDLIFCRHVIIYFTEYHKQEVLNKMAAILRPGGILFLGNSEILPAGVSNLKPEIFKNNKYYRV